MAPLSSDSSSNPTRDSSFCDEPPSYAGAVNRPSSLPSPLYTPSPRECELIIRTSSEATCLSAQNYVYRSKHVTVSLGPKMWRTSSPVYSNNASVEGTLSLSGDLKNLTSICIKLQGIVTSTYTERGLITGSSSVNILEVISSITMPSVGNLAEDRAFSLSFPTTGDESHRGLPPSAIIYHPGVTCTVKYLLKVKLVRKGLHRNESLRIPLLYLPRTFARGPLLPLIPDIIGAQRPSIEIQGLHTVQLKPCGKKGLIGNVSSISLVLPSTLSFASDDVIPLALIIAPAENGVLANLLLSEAKIQLIKRTRTWVNGGRSSSKHDSLVGTAQVATNDADRVDANVVAYELRASQTTLNRSWAVDGAAEQQYLIRVMIRPPPAVAAHIPGYECEQPIELTTDPYESFERETVLLGGSPTPAIGSLAISSLNRTGGPVSPYSSFR